MVFAHAGALHYDGRVRAGGIKAQPANGLAGLRVEERWVAHTLKKAQ